MTLNDLEKEVAHLGFENQIEDRSLLISAANRALGILYRELPVLERQRLYKRADMPLAYVAKIEGEGGEKITLSLFGKAYSFRISGIGSYTVCDKNGRTKTENFDGENLLCRDFSDGGEICFSSDYAYTVLDFACHKDTSGPDLTDIKEYARFEIYDLNELFGNFVSFAEEAKDGAGRTIKDALCEGAVLSLPREYSGEVNIKYERSPRLITEDDGEREIDITPEMRTLLPLLVSAFIWLDDDWDKSQYYMSLYKDTLASVFRSGSREFNSKYTTNGWA